MLKVFSEKGGRGPAGKAETLTAPNADSLGNRLPSHCQHSTGSVPVSAHEYAENQGLEINATAARSIAGEVSENLSARTVRPRSCDKNLSLHPKQHFGVGLSRQCLRGRIRVNITRSRLEI